MCVLKTERWLRNHARLCQEIICLQTPTNIIEETVQEPCLEVNPTEQDLIHSSHLHYNKQDQDLDKTGNQEDHMGINVVDEINLHCLIENFPSTSTCTNTTAKKKTPNKLKLNIK